MCLACLRNSFEEVGVAGASKGDSGRRGAERGNGGSDRSWTSGSKDSRLKRLSVLRVCILPTLI